MPDFSQLLNKPAGEAKRPPPLPAGDYYGIVKSYEVGDNNRNKTPYVRFQVGLTDWPDSSEDEWIHAESNGESHNVTKADIDLSKRQMRKDYYFTDEALWRLDEFIRSCGVDPQGRSYTVVIPELVGVPVTVEVTQYLNQNNNETGNQIGKLVGQT